MRCALYADASISPIFHLLRAAIESYAIRLDCRLASHEAAAIIEAGFTGTLIWAMAHF